MKAHLAMVVSKKHCNLAYVLLHDDLRPLDTCGVWGSMHHRRLRQLVHWCNINSSTNSVTLSGLHNGGNMVAMLHCYRTCTCSHQQLQPPSAATLKAALRITAE
jgi:hypothetical protein